MKVKVESKKSKSFVPYTVTFVINTEEESEWFHDNVAIKISSINMNKHRQFTANIYERVADTLSGHNEFDI